VFFKSPVVLRLQNCVKYWTYIHIWASQGVGYADLLDGILSKKKTVLMIYVFIIIFCPFLNFFFTACPSCSLTHKLFLLSYLVSLLSSLFLNFFLCFSPNLFPSSYFWPLSSFLYIFLALYRVCFSFSLPLYYFRRSCSFLLSLCPPVLPFLIALYSLLPLYLWLSDQPLTPSFRWQTPFSGEMKNSPLMTNYPWAHVFS